MATSIPIELIEPIEPIKGHSVVYESNSSDAVNALEHAEHLPTTITGLMFDKSSKASDLQKANVESILSTLWTTGLGHIKAGGVAGAYELIAKLCEHVPDIPGTDWNLPVIPEWSVSTAILTPIVVMALLNSNNGHDKEYMDKIMEGDKEMNGMEKKFLNELIPEGSYMKSKIEERLSEMKEYLFVNRDPNNFTTIEIESYKLHLDYMNTISDITNTYITILNVSNNGLYRMINDMVTDVTDEDDENGDLVGAKPDHVQISSSQVEPVSAADVQASTHEQEKKGNHKQQLTALGASAGVTFLSVLPGTLNTLAAASAKVAFLTFTPLPVLIIISSITLIIGFINNQYKQHLKKKEVLELYGNIYDIIVDKQKEMNKMIDEHIKLYPEFDAEDLKYNQMLTPFDQTTMDTVTRASPGDLNKLKKESVEKMYNNFFQINAPETESISTKYMKGLLALLDLRTTGTCNVITTDEEDTYHRLQLLTSNTREIILEINFPEINIPEDEWREWSVSRRDLWEVDAKLKLNVKVSDNISFNQLKTEIQKQVTGNVKILENKMRSPVTTPVKSPKAPMMIDDLESQQSMGTPVPEGLSEQQGLLPEQQGLLPEGQTPLHLSPRAATGEVAGTDLVPSQDLSEQEDLEYAKAIKINEFLTNNEVDLVLPDYDATKESVHFDKGLRICFSKKIKAGENNWDAEMTKTTFEQKDKHGNIIDKYQYQKRYKFININLLKDLQSPIKIGDLQSPIKIDIRVASPSYICKTPLDMLCIVLDVYVYWKNNKGKAEDSICKKFRDKMFELQKDLNPTDENFPAQVRRDFLRFLYTIYKDLLERDKHFSNSDIFGRNLRIQKHRSREHLLGTRGVKRRDHTTNGILYTFDKLKKKPFNMTFERISDLLKELEKIKKDGEELEKKINGKKTTRELYNLWTYFYRKYMHEKCTLWPTLTNAWEYINYAFKSGIPASTLGSKARKKCLEHKLYISNFDDTDPTRVEGPWTLKELAKHILFGDWAAILGVGNNIPQISSPPTKTIKVAYELKGEGGFLGWGRNVSGYSFLSWEKLAELIGPKTIAEEASKNLPTPHKPWTNVQMWGVDNENLPTTLRFKLKDIITSKMLRYALAGALYQTPAALLLKDKIQQLGWGEKWDNAPSYLIDVMNHPTDFAKRLRLLPTGTKISMECGQTGDKCGVNLFNPIKLYDIDPSKTAVNFEEWITNAHKQLYHTAHALPIGEGGGRHALYHERQKIYTRELIRLFTNALPNKLEFWNKLHESSDKHFNNISIDEDVIKVTEIIYIEFKNDLLRLAEENRKKEEVRREKEKVQRQAEVPGPWANSKGDALKNTALSMLTGMNVKTRAGGGSKKKTRNKYRNKKKTRRTYRNKKKTRNKYRNKKKTRKTYRNKKQTQSK